MCGRFVLSTPGQALATQFQQFQVNAPLATTGRFNVAPTQEIPVLRRNHESGDAEWAELRWGLVPSWAKDPSIGARMINARSETVASKPSFRAAFRKRRCIVPMTGFYEWKRSGNVKQPYYFSDPSQPVLAVAGLWEHWHGPGGEFIDSVSMLTTAANALMASIHHRMPVILDEEGCKLWLDKSVEREAELGHLFEMGEPGTEGEQQLNNLKCHPVAQTVNNARNNEASNIEEVSL